MYYNNLRTFKLISITTLSLLLLFPAFTSAAEPYETQITDLQHAGDTDKAVALARKYLETVNKKYNNDHENNLRASYVLGRALFMDAQYEEAIKILGATLSAFEKKLGEDHPGLEPYITSLSALYYTVSRFEDGDRISRKARGLRNQ